MVERAGAPMQTHQSSALVPLMWTYCWFLKSWPTDRDDGSHVAAPEAEAGEEDPARTKASATALRTMAERAAVGQVRPIVSSTVRVYFVTKVHKVRIIYPAKGCVQIWHA